MDTLTTSPYAATIVALTAIVAATVAVCLGQIDASTFAAIVAGAGGFGAGAGVHAAGVSQGIPVTPPLDRPR